MRSDFDELKRFAIADILSVSGRQKTTETVDMHINTIIDIAFLKGQQASQPKITELQKQLIDQGQRFNEQAQRVKDLEHKNNELQKRLDAFKEHAVMLREAAKSHVYTEREQNILISQADDIDKILGLEQALKGEQQLILITK